MASTNRNDFLSPKNRPPLPQQQLLHGPWNRKSIATILSQQQHNCDPSSTNEPDSSHHTYTMFDLVSVGVGGTVGSGIFVLTGYIANHYAGPATFLSFLVSGMAALCSGISFAEFSGRLPRIEGSTYT